MKRDPFYRQIVERLNGLLDDDDFERCAADILRANHPTLVPIRGGSDSGMDGAIADGEGEPFPLITTTSKNVIGNLTRNLNQYLAEGGPRRKAILATSQALTPQKRRNLNRRASELGFTLIQIYEQAAIADLLRHRPEWCRELLNLTGNPPPLSAIPHTNRPLANLPLIGREADLAWLNQASGDRLLVGQPGSGKTFLFHQLAQEGKGLFVIRPQIGEIAAQLRALQTDAEPLPALMIDDAQSSLELLSDLRHMRQEIGAEFAIIASSWPGAEESLAVTLNLPTTQIHRLDRLTRDEIVQIINVAGLQGPNLLVHEIVNQAEGLPGLAVTLTWLCLQGDVRRVALGDFLSASVLRFFEPLVGQHASHILAALAVSGDSGLTMQAVAHATGLPLIDIRALLTRLAAGGVIMETSGQRLTVRPPALRHALIRDVFFRGALSLPIEPVLTQITSATETALALIGAQGRGAIISPALLKPLIEQADSQEVWQEYARLGREEVNWLLGQHPELLTTIARPALHHAPEITLPRLLSAAIGDQRPLHANTDHPLRLIQDWVKSAHPGTPAVLQRRRTLLKAVGDWLTSDGDWMVSIQSLQAVLSPEFHDHEVDPGSGNRVTLLSGYVSTDDARAIQEFWPRILNLVTHGEVANWRSIRDMVEMWAYPGRLNAHISAELNDLMRAFAARMLQDVVAIAERHPGTLHWARQVAEHLDLVLPLPLNAEFETLYPHRSHNVDWREAEQREAAAVRELAERWSRATPGDTAVQITHIETEAGLADVRWPRYTPWLCSEIAGQVTTPLAWAQAVIEAGCSGELVAPFLRRAYEANEVGWKELALTCLERPPLRSAAITLALTMSQPDEDLLAQVLTQLEGYTEYVRWGGARREIPEHQTRLLLHHPDAAIACAAADGIWHASKGRIPDPFRDEWRRVVLRSGADRHWLIEVLGADPELAYHWLQTRFADEDPDFFGVTHERVIEAAVSGLSKEARRALLLQIPDSDRYGFVEVVTPLINGHPALYRDLLSNEQLRWFHLTPLAGTPEGEWLEKALMAVEAGYSPNDIARAAYSPRGFTFQRGNESAMWSEWVEHFERLCAHDDERLRRIGEAGKAQVSHLLEEARRRERREAIYGLE